MRPYTPFAAWGRRRYPKHAQQSSTVWLFDLDNTLHNASHAIFNAIDSRMALAVADSLQLPLDEADYLRTHYWERYGATMIGLHRHHNVDAHEFLRRSHDFDVPALLQHEAQIATYIKRLVGRKIVLTNAPRHYAQQVIHALKLDAVFDGIWAIEDMQLQGQFRPKPSLVLMRQLLARLAVPAQRVILVEDTLRNLKTAKQLGMQTVHIFNAGTPYSAMHRGRSQFVDLRVNSIRELAQRQRCLSLVEFLPVDK